MLHPALSQEVDVKKASESSVAAFALVSGLLIGGCATSTERQLLESQIDLHTRAIGESQRTLEQLKASAGGPGPYQFKGYVSTSTLNRAFAALDGFTFG